jgi:hypothetical protein
VLGVQGTSAITATGGSALTVSRLAGAPIAVNIPSTTAASVAPAVSVADQAVTLTATVLAGLTGFGAPTGSIQFQIDGSNSNAPVPVGQSLTTSALAAGTHTITAIYSGDDQFAGSVASTSIVVNALTASNVQSALSNVPQSGTLTFQPASTTDMNTIVQGINGAAPSSTVNVTVDLAGQTVAPSTAISAPSTVPIDLTSSTGTATAQDVTVNGGTIVIDASVAPQMWTVNGGNVTVEGSAEATDFIVNGGTVTLANGTILTGHSPALIVNGGTVVLQGVKAQTPTAAPTIVVNGGSLTVRQSTIQESTGSSQVAILVNGGTVDLGTTASPGGNTFNVNGTGTLIANSTGNSIAAVGDTFENNGSLVSVSFGVVALSAAPTQAASLGVPQVFNLGALTDTGHDNQSWAVTVDWGDGSSPTVLNATATGSLTGQSHAYGLPGSYTVTVTAADPLAGQVSAWSLVQTFTVTVAPSIFVLDPMASGALSLSGNANLNVPGAVIVDSSSKSALSASGNAQISASRIFVAGGISTSGNAVLHPAATTGATAIGNPFRSLTAPSPSGLSSWGSVNLSGNSTRTITQGIYSSIQVAGNAALILSPGIYIVQGGSFTVSGNASVSGQGVLIDIMATNGLYGSLNLSGNGKFGLTPQTAGPYKDILIMQAANDPRALAISGNAVASLGNAVLYAPSALLTVSGGGQLTASAVVDQLQLTGNASSTLVTDGSAAASNADAGQLLAGNLELYVDNGNGGLTPDELSLIADAVGAWDTVLAPYGQAITEVPSADEANLIVASATTSAAGGFSDGVLGCYNDNGLITIVQGWNFYAGADPSGIGPDQFDFESIVLHELGHALGLGHSVDPTSVMYGSITLGIVRRTPIAADLNVPSLDTSADALRVSPAAPAAIPPPIAAPTFVIAGAPAGPTTAVQPIRSVVSVPSPQFEGQSTNIVAQRADDRGVRTATARLGRSAPAAGVDYAPRIEALERVLHDWQTSPARDALDDWDDGALIDSPTSKTVIAETRWDLLPADPLSENRAAGRLVETLQTRGVNDTAWSLLTLFTAGYAIVSRRAERHGRRDVVTPRQIRPARESR